MKFDQTGLAPEIITAVEALGFTDLTPIQEKTIPALLKGGQDLIALAQTGTGKTAAFGLPIVHLADENDRHTQALILCPTRELCLQICKDLADFSKFLKKLDTVAVYGGAAIYTQIKALKKGAQIVVGTPGRTLDLIKRGELKLQNLRWLVLDEADEMLNMGFKEDLDAILEATSGDKQTLLFSATMAHRVAKIANKYLKNAQEISVAQRNISAENVSHTYYIVPPRSRYGALKRLIDANPGIYGIVFCRTRGETREVAEELGREGYNAAEINGDLSQQQRDHVMGRFRKGSLQLLVATDVAARGVDVNDLTHVINFNLPDDPEVYIHRSGRTGRAGKSGVSVSLITQRERYRIRDLERLSGKTFIQGQLPSGEEVCTMQLMHLAEKIKLTKVDDAQMENLLPPIVAKLKSLTKEELIKRFMSFEAERLLEYYRTAPDLNVSPDKFERNKREERGSERERPARKKEKFGEKGSYEKKERFSDREKFGDRKEKPTKSSGGSRYTGYYLNAGTQMSMSPKKLIDMINDLTQNRDVTIGQIRILKKVTFFEVSKGFEKEIENAFEGAKYNGNQVVLQPAPDQETKETGATPFYKKAIKKGPKGRGAKVHRK